MNQFAKHFLALLAGCSGAVSGLAQPVINSMTPSSGPTEGGTIITLAGTNFLGAGTAVLFRSVPITAATTNNTNLTFALPIGQGVNAPVQVVANNQTSAPVAFSYQAPLLT